MLQHIEVEGMGCDHCVNALRQALEGVDNVQVKEVEIGRAVIEADPSVNDDVDRAIREAGYEPISRSEA